LASFEVVFPLAAGFWFSGLVLRLPFEPPIPAMAGFSAPKSVITSLAGFGARRPQPGPTHRDPSRFQVLTGGFTTDAGGLLDLP